MVDQNAAAGALHAAGVRGHPNWLAPDWVRDVVGPPKLDGTEWVSRVADAGVGSLLFVTKGHDGMCYWPTALPSPRTDQDLLGEVCTQGGRSGVRIYAYYSMAIDDHQVCEHPDWAFVDRDGVGCEAIGFRWACLNSPYGVYARTQIAEILEHYPVDSIWLDIYALGPRERDCLCRWCRALYAERHGGDLATVTDPAVLGDWKVDCLVEHLNAIRDDRDRLRPKALIAFNGAGAGFRRHPEATLSSLRLFELVDFLSDEGHDPRFESAMSKAMRAHGRPFEVLTSNGIANEWLGWVTKPAGLLSLEGAVVGSHGGSFGLGLSVLPDGEMPEGELAVVARATAFLGARAPWFVPQEPASDVRVLIQTFRERGEFVPPERPEPEPRLPRDGAHHSPTVYDPDPIANGLWDALKEAHLPFDFVHEYRGLDGVETLFLQGSARLSDAYCDEMRAFVRRGGTLIAEGHATLLDEDGARRPDFALADVLGVHFRGYAGAWDANYLQVDDPALRVGLPDYPLLVTGQGLRVEIDGADVLARLIAPIGGEQTITHHVAALYNPPGPVSDVPAITAHAYGEGRGIYLAQGLGAHIRARRDVDAWTKRLVANLAGEGPLRTSAPPGVELVLNQAPHGGLWLHLLNHYGAAPELGPEAGPEIAPITIALNDARLGPIASATVEPGGHQLALDRGEDGWVTLVAPAFAVHQVLDLRIEAVERARVGGRSVPASQSAP